MSDISISSSNTEKVVMELISKIQTEIINSSEASGNTVINAIEHSAGDFIGSLKEEMVQEITIMNSVGELLIEMAKYIQSASIAFENVDTIYNNSKV